MYVKQHQNWYRNAIQIVFLHVLGGIIIFNTSPGHNAKACLSDHYIYMKSVVSLHVIDTSSR